MRARKVSGAIAALLAAVGLVIGSRAAPESRAARQPGGGQEKPDTAAVLTGTSSCSGRGCHGSLEPMTDPKAIQHNEFTTWVMHDRHADAYRVLFQPRSQDIARKLYGPDRPAHKEKRCLACHVVPQAAASDSPALLLGGVGCEACHGPARDWLGPHTTEEWKNLKGEAKRAEQLKLKMTPTGDPAELARACAGCHIGAPDRGDGILLRDVNHDLIAAGHPRLDFEFGAFLANMPRHWRPGQNKDLENASLVWTVGQLASARAALELLADRARAAEAKRPDPERPWPEFAEYNCFACHHDLREPSWRQKERGYKGRPGSLPLSDWYFFMPRELAAQAPSPAPTLPPALDGLRKSMARPYPDPKQVSGQAKQAAVLLDGWLQKLAPQKDKLDRVVLRGTLGAIAQHEKKLNELSWDEAAQLYLAVAALVEGDKQKQTALRKLHCRLSFPAGLDSPSDFRTKDGQVKSPKDLADGLGELLK